MEKPKLKAQTEGLDKLLKCILKNQDVDKLYIILGGQRLARPQEVN
jgi:hypothetical protein